MRSEKLCVLSLPKDEVKTERVKSWKDKLMPTLTLILMLMLTILVGSCNRRPLYYEHVTPVKVVVSMDWMYLGSVPDGATILFYPEGKVGCYSFKTNSVDHAIVSVPTGYYTVMVFNRTVDEYATMSFYDMDTLGMASALLNTKYFSWLGIADSIGRTVYEPEVIVCGRTDHFYVREKINNIISADSVVKRDAELDEVDTVWVTPQQMNYNGTVNVRVNGIHNVKSVRSYLTGMAGGSYLAIRSANEQVATHVIESWKIQRDETDYTKGYLVGSFTCFGLPEQYKTEKDIFNNHFFITLLLVDDQTTVTRTYEVGDRIEEVEQERRVDLTVGIGANPQDTPIDVPDVKPTGGSSTGFDVNLDDWQSGGEVVIPM